MNRRNSIFERIRCALLVLIGTPVVFRVDFAGPARVKAKQSNVYWAACPGTLQVNGREMLPWYKEGED